VADINKKYMDTPLQTTTQSSFAGMSRKESQMRAIRSKLGKDEERKVIKPGSKEDLDHYMRKHKDDKFK
jgi:hypothetical protein